MAGKRFETGVQINAGSEGLIVQQKPGATAAPIQVLSHDATPMFTIHTSGEVTAPMGINIGSATKTEINYLSGVTSNIQSQLNTKSPSATPTFTGPVTLPSTTSIGPVTSAQIGYLNGVTSAIQTQLNAKAPSATPSFTGPMSATSISATSLTLSGNLTVNGTTTTINSTDVSVDDINITLGDTSSPTDTTANGGGITLKGSTDKSITWSSSTGSWGFSPSAVFVTVAAQGRGAAIAGDSAGGSAILQFVNNGVTAQWGSIVATSGGKLVLNTQNDGVGIGGTPSYPFHIQSSNYNIMAVESSGSETKVNLINTSTNGRTYSIISGGSGGAFSGGLFGIWDNTSSTLRVSISNAGNIRLNGGLQMGSRNRQQTGTGGLNVTFGSVLSDEFGDANRVVYYCGTSGVSTWYGTPSKVFGAIDGNGTTGLSFWSNDDSGGWANIFNYGSTQITANRHFYATSTATFGGTGTNAWSMPYLAMLFNRLWDSYPGIQINNDTTWGPITEFRIHGYSGVSGGDFSINLRIDGSYLNLSDARIKTNVNPISNALQIVKNLQGVRYQRMNRSLEPETHSNINNGIKFGLIAQDSIPHIPECVSQTLDAQPLENGWCDEYAMDYAQLTPLLIEAVKELSNELQELKNSLNSN